MRRTPPPVYVEPPPPQRRAGAGVLGLAGAVVAGIALAYYRAAAPWAFGGAGVLIVVCWRPTRGVLLALLRLPLRAWIGLVACAGLAVGWLYLGPWLLAVVAVGLICGAVMIASPGSASGRPSEATRVVKPGSDTEWRAWLEEQWPTVAARTGLHDDGDSTALAELAGPVEPVGPGAAALRVDLFPARKVADDVAGKVERLRRETRSLVTLVRPDPDDVDFVDVRLYRGFPLRQARSWRDLRPVDLAAGERAAPVGWTAFGDQATDDPGQHKLIMGEMGTGKTFLVRALMAGMEVQGLPWLPYVIDKDGSGDFRALAEVASVWGGYAAGTRKWTEAASVLDRFEETLDRLYAESPQIAVGDEHAPTLALPSPVLVLSELLDIVSAKGEARVAGLMRRARQAGAPVIATAQLTQVSNVSYIRDLFQRRYLLRVTNGSLVNPALGEDALERGARADRLPAQKWARGLAYQVDAETRWPALIRVAEVPSQEFEKAVVNPLRRRTRRLRVVGNEE